MRTYHETSLTKLSLSEIPALALNIDKYVSPMKSSWNNFVISISQNIFQWTIGSFSNCTVRVTTETSGVGGTGSTVQVNFPFKSGIIFPT
jgi:hypothetical protein